MFAGRTGKTDKTKTDKPDRKKAAAGKAAESAREREFDSLLKTLQGDPRTQQMKTFTQHGRVSTWEHCRDVAALSRKIDRTFHLNSSPRELVRGAFLHDYYLYDWHRHDGRLHWHGFTHPKTAMENADRDFGLTDKEANIIRSHMWPLTLFHVPRSREAVIVCIADKICSCRETALRR